MISSNSKLLERLEERARDLRITAPDMTHQRGKGHPGGSLAAAEIQEAGQKQWNKK